MLSDHALTVNHLVIFLLLTLCQLFNFDNGLIDVTSALFNGNLLKPIHLKASFSKNGNIIFKVFGNIYGLQYAGSTWNKLITRWILGYGFQRSTLAECIYFLFQ